MHRAIIVLLAGSSLLFTAGCATKKYVRNDAAPIIKKTNELDELTAKTTNDIRSTDARATAGIANAKSAAATADQHASAANQAAQQAQGSAQNALNQATSLQNTVVNLDNYKEVSEAQVHFGFNKADLTKKAKLALDELSGNINSTKGYIVELVGGADSVGSADYNYQLSQRRAASVVQYLAAKYNVPAYKIYVIGLGKDQATGHNAKARAEDRRVDVKLMSNTGAPDQNTPAPQVSQTQPTATTPR